MNMGPDTPQQMSHQYSGIILVVQWTWAGLGCPAVPVLPCA